jgi:hypothetical protein
LTAQLKTKFSVGMTMVKDTRGTEICL